MKKIILFLSGFFVLSNANATLVFSDVSYTSDTVSFRTTGDLSGYAIPARPGFFSLTFEGDLFTSGVNANINWTNAIFTGASVWNKGNSGDWESWNTPGAWLMFSSPLVSTTTALGAITTLRLGGNVLNESSLTGEIVFNWDIDADFTSHTELGRVTVGQIPEPTALVLLSMGLVGLGIRRKFTA